jgi:integrase
LEARLAIGINVFEEQKEPTPLAPSIPTLLSFSKIWLETVEHERKPSTAGFYGQYLRLYVLPSFGELTLDRIERDAVKQFIARLRSRGLAKNTIRLAVTTLRAVLTAAVEDRLIQYNPALGLGRFVKSEKPQREAASLKASEVDRLLGAARTNLPFQDYALLLTALRAGLREGELAGLAWSHIYFGDSEEDPERYILVQRNYDRRWSRRMLTPKSTKTRRVDMSRELRRVLWQLRDERLAEAPSPQPKLSDKLVFPSQAGTPIEMNNFSERTFKPLVEQAGLRRMRFHDLRHRADSPIMPTVFQKDSPACCLARSSVLG